MTADLYRNHNPLALRRRILSVLAAAALLAAPPALLAQTESGGVEILVLSVGLSEAVIDREVTLTDEQGRVRTCTTDDEGRCFFGSIAPGSYEVTVRTDTAVTDEPRRIRVYPGRRVSLTLRVVTPLPETLSPTERATRLARPVPAPAPEEGWLAERASTERLGTSGTAQTAARLPNRSADLSSVFEMQPGSALSTGGVLGGFVFNGQPSSQNVLREGGLDTTPIVLAPTSFQDTNALIFDVNSRKSLKEFKTFNLDTNNSPAALGTGTGGKLLTDITGGGKKHAGEVYGFFTDDAFGARNFFDPRVKPDLSFNLFGAQIGGPLHNFGKGEVPKLFYFVNYEGIRAHSGNTIYAAAPSAAAMARADASVGPLLDTYFAGGATIVTGASTDPDFEILRLDTRNRARRNSVTARLDYNLNPEKIDKLEFLYTRAHSTEDTPDGVTGRRQINRNVKQTGVLRHLWQLKGGDAAKLRSSDESDITNEFLVGINITPSRLGARTPLLEAVDLSRSVFGVGGKIGQRGIEGQPATLGVATPGGLLSGNSQRGLLYTPSSFSIIDQVVWRKPKKHTYTFGGEARFLETYVDQLYGTTYSFANLADLLANRSATVQFNGDLGSFTDPSGLSRGERRARQRYYIAFAQDEWKLRDNFKMTYGLRYEYYSVLREANDRAVVFDAENGRLLPAGAPFYRAAENNFMPRVAVSWGSAPSKPSDDEEAVAINLRPTVVSASFGMYVGPGVFTDLIKPIESDRIQVTQRGAAFPVAPDLLAASFFSNLDDARFQPSALARDYTTPTRVYKYDVSVKRDLIDRVKDSKELFLVLTYSGNQSRNLLLRNFANRIVGVETNPDPAQTAVVTREFDFVRGGQTFHPFGEIEFRTTGGRASYNSLQVSLKGQAITRALAFFEAQYTLASSRGNTNGAEKTAAASNTFDYDADYGYNADDVRHKFSLAAVIAKPCESAGLCKASSFAALRHALGGWTVGALASLQSGRPVEVSITRPDVVYLDADGNVFSTPAVGRRAVVNVPGGGASLKSRRPDLVPGVSPYLDGDRTHLNPAAFAIPAPGTFGNLPRGFLRAPAQRFVDLSVKKDFALDGRDEPVRILSFRVDITNVLNMTNFAAPVSTLSDVLGTDAAANQLQPGQPFTAAAVSDFGILNRTAKREQDLGASRQFQFRLSLAF